MLFLKRIEFLLIGICRNKIMRRCIFYSSVALLGFEIDLQQIKLCNR